MKERKEMMEVDVLSLVKVLWQRKFFIFFISLLAAVLAFGYSRFLVKPEYTSTTRIYVISRSQEGNNAAVTNQDLQAGAYLVKDYYEIILSPDVMSQVSQELKLNIDSKDLISKISVSVPTDTRIVSISVNDSNPNEASRIANAVRKIASKKIIEVAHVSDVTTLEEAQPATAPSSPNIRRNTVYGFIAGAGVSIVIIFLASVFDNRIRRPEDIENAMGLTLLGVVPSMKKTKK